MELFYRPQPNASEGDLRSSVEVVTIIDPHHPLFGRTFPLLSIVRSANSVQCCVVQFNQDRLRRISIEVTDRSPQPISQYPIPLNLSSLGQLLKAFANISSKLGSGSMT
jgi:hypothetical protein